ncbi:hypothetical protein GCM10023085_14650 [Actinomadura viridis]|uniref:DUF397 domain-containing protein n=1 Tax=Actinomadura viridis TaxID=58110 RepID=A0A931DU02_9ACTN|nr:DUF397 domain-containing protein [Actinomadura viridis]MBG6093836.1 hypothetical protein [Actinomadura viridis]
MTTNWRKSARSSEGTSEQCVEVARLSEGIGVRDSKNPDGPNLVVSRDVFKAFTAALKK